jgi:hypothetical protein
MIPGTLERRGFHCTWHGTVDLSAALNTATGKVIGKLLTHLRAGTRAPCRYWPREPLKVVARWFCGGVKETPGGYVHMSAASYLL